MGAYEHRSEPPDTELMQLRQELLAAKDVERRKDEFLALLAHQMRNPLTPISNAAEMLRLFAGDPVELARAQQILRRQVNQLVRIVDDLVDFQRALEGKIRLRRQIVPAADVVHLAVEMNRPSIDARGLQFDVHIPREPLYLDADPARLAQAITHLLQNSAKFTDKGGHIWLSAVKEDTECVFSVRDTGMGIAAESLSNIFASRQVPAAPARNRGGPGIGLILVRNLVQLHGGSIGAMSPGPGLGSEFVIRLPLPRLPADSAAPEDQRRPAQRIVVIDDNEDSAQSTAELIGLAGHEVRVAYDGTTGIELAKEFQPHVGFIDIGLPDVDGYEIARRFRQDLALKDMKLAAVSGYGQEEDRARSKEAGFDEHFVKPIDVAALQNFIRGS